MSNAILACGSLVDYMMEAQRRMGTAWPMTVLDRKYHRDPKEMRAHVIDAVNVAINEANQA